MGIRFRKTVKAGPVNLNFSKSGVGYSVGGKGYRYTKKASGGTRTTASIPGTGISYVKESSAKKKGKGSKYSGSFESSRRSGGNGGSGQNVNLVELLLAWFLGFLGAHKFYRKKFGMGFLYLLSLGLFFVGWIGDAIWLTICFFSAKGGKGAPSKGEIPCFLTAALCVITLACCSGGNGNTGAPAETQETIAQTIGAATETTSPVGPTQTIPVTQPPATRAVETIAATGPEPTETVGAETEPVETEKIGTTYILNTGTHKFHRQGCSSIGEMKESNKKTFTGSREEVIAMGYKPCGRCNP